MIIKEEDNCFILYEIDNGIDIIYLSSKYGEMSFDVYKNTIIISANNLTNLTKNEICFIDIYTSFSSSQKEKVPLIMSDKITFMGRTELVANGRLYSCYISTNGAIRIFNEGFISNKGITDKVYAKDVIIEEKEIKLMVVLKTKFILPTKFNLFIRDRKTKKQIVFSSTNFLSSLLDSNKDSFETCCIVSINKELLSSFTIELLDKRSNHFNSLDFYYNFEITEYTSSKYAFRLEVKNNKDTNKEFTLIKNNKIQLYTIISTIFGNLTFNYFHYPKDSKKYLSNFSQNKLISKDHPIILVVEYPYSARDNGLTIFKYLIKNHKDKFDIYYVIDNDSPDLKNLFEYKDNVLFQGSDDHHYYYIHSDIILHSHSSIYVVPMMTQHYLKVLSNKKRYFIQHGVIGKRDLSSLYGYNDGTFTDYFITSSKRESKIVEKSYGFPKGTILQYGLSRFDNLFTKSQKIKDFIRQKNRKKIFIFFSWRPELQKVNEIQFKNSTYFNKIIELLNSEVFTGNKSMIGIFRLHPNMEKYSYLFEEHLNHNSNVTISNETDPISIQEYILQTDIMITDFSSAALDFAIIKKPVIYYEITDEGNVYNNSDEFLPGIKLKTLNQVVAYILKLRKFNSKYRYDRKKLDNIYSYRDTKACQRLAQHIIENVE